MVGRVRSKGSGVLNTHFLGRSPTAGWTARYSNPHGRVCYDQTHPGPPYRSGGSLVISGTSMEHTPSSSLTFDNDLLGHYQGGFIVSGVPANGIWGGAIPPSLGDSGWTDGPSGAWMSSNSGSLESQGAAGWNAAKPGKPIVDLGQTLGELRNVPSLPGTSSKGGGGSLSSFIRNGGGARDLQRRVNRAKRGADEYLNYQFGWKPLLQDLAKMVGLKDEIDAKLSQLKRDNGKGIRRRRTLTNIEDRDVWVTRGYDTLMWPGLHPFYYVNNSGKRVVTHEKRRKDWFEAKFRYYIPDIGMPGYPGPSAAKLLGLNPSPSLAWELLPWTWLIDYFANVGDVLSNMSENAAENLVADYAYVMSTVQFVETVEESIIMRNVPHGARFTVTAKCTVTKEMKRRAAASPFGFGLKPGDLSGKQASILGALGISRSF